MLLLLFFAVSQLVTLSQAAPPISWPGPYPGITYQELRPLVNKGDLFLLDVRNRSELLSPGRIPHSLNLPLPELATALQLTSSEFQNKYGFTLPPPEKEIILVCRSGRRIQVAAAMMIPAGFKNLRLYYGSFKDWVKQGAPISREVSAIEVQVILEEKAGVVVDIRTKQEQQKTGVISGSISIPNLETLQLPSAEFKTKLGFAKPSPKELVTVIGGSATRTLGILPLLNKLNYCKLRLYLGSVEELDMIV